MSVVVFVVLLSIFYTESTCQLVFRDSPASSIALFNFPATLRCSAYEPNPPPNITWLKDGVISESDPRGRFNVSYDPATGRSLYSISIVSYFDEGTYQCVAVNASGSIIAMSNVGQLTVQGYPGFVNPLPSVIVPLGSTAVFECAVQSNPSANISWSYQDNSPIPFSSRFTISPPNTLTIESVQMSDERFYVCHAINAYGRNSTSARLTIGTPPPELNLMVTPSSPNPLIRTQGEPLTLSCSVSPSGSQYSSLVWTRGSTVVTNVAQTADTLLLNVIAVQFQDGGLYTCTLVETNGDTQTASIRVEVNVPPQFTSTPQDIMVIDSQPFAFISTCSAVGEPDPMITWHRADGSEIRTQNGIPQLGTLTRADAGMYACIASNSVGQIRHEFTVTVQGSPLFTIPPGNLEASFGQNVVFRCIAQGPPDPTYSWTRLNMNGIPEALPEGTVLSTDSTQLHLLSVTSADIGTYQCNATNVFGTAVAQGTLTILSRPQIFNATNGPIYSEIGTTLLLMCTFTGPPSIVQVWTLNGVQLLPNQDPNINIGSDGTLSVRNAQEQYSGEYVCNVTTSYAFDLVRITVFIGRPPQLIQAPSDTDISPGLTAIIPCISSGQPQPWSTWFKTDVFGTRSELPTVGSSFTKLSTGLELHDVSREDSGIYECMVDNGIGTVQKSVTVRVEGAPLVSSIVPSTIRAGEAIASVECVIVFNYPEGTITWRRTDGVELPSDRFTVSSTGSLQIANVTTSDQGVYVCNVTNFYGASSASGTVSVLVGPTINLQSSEVAVVIQTRSTIRCPTSGNPTPQIQWLYQGVDPLTDNHFEIDSADLIIPAPSIELDGGILTCIASNEIGTVTARIMLLVRGPPPNSLNVSTTTTTAVVRWSHSEPVAVAPLTNYQIDIGRPGQTEDRIIRLLPSFRTAEFISDLLPYIEYEFIVRGIFSNGLLGLNAVVVQTTDQSVPSGPPQNITLSPRGGGFNIKWTLPLESERNGVIISYTIMYRRVVVNNSIPFFGLGPSLETIDTPFSTHVYNRNITEVHHSLTIDGLEALVLYEVMLLASTIVGDGPQSALLNVTTQTPIVIPNVDLQLAVRATIGVGASVLGVLLLVACVLFVCIIWIPCWRRYTKTGKHEPHTDEEDFNRQQKKQKSSGGQSKSISGPIPGVSSKFDSSVGGKFTAVKPPKIVKPEDMAPPPKDGERVKVVSHDEIFVSQRGTDTYDAPADAVDSTLYSVPRRQPSTPTTGPVIRPESGVYSEVADITNDGQTQGGSAPEPKVVAVQPPSPERRGPEGEDTGRDDDQLIYSSISKEHKQKKREKMNMEVLKVEIQQQKQEKKMQEKMEREKQKQEEKRHKQEEKERKKQAKEMKQRHNLGLDNVVHLHELDFSKKEARAQAQFIDNATAALF